MFRAIYILTYWLPVALWMLLIFLGSSDSRSGPRSSRIIGPIVRWVFPDISEPALDMIVAVLRKVAHVLEYAVLAALVWRARRGPVREAERHWNGAHARFALLISVVYAVTDEMHQAFVPNRGPNLWDVVLDAAGAAFGLCVIWLYFRLKHLRTK